MSQYSTSNLSTTLNLNSAISYNRYLYEQKILQISTGRAYNKRSDDASATDEIARLKNEITKIDQWDSNLGMARGWELATETNLNSVLGLMGRATELTVSANNGTLSPEERENISIEVDGIIESLLQVANADYVGTPLFAGKGIKPAHTAEWSEISTSVKPKYPSDLGMPSNHGWSTLTEDEYLEWKVANPYSVDPGWDGAAGKTREWPQASEPHYSGSLSGPYDPNAGMPERKSWNELEPDEYMDWRDAQMANTSPPGQTDFFDPGWDAVNKHPNPWPTPSPEPVCGMNGMPSGHAWNELTEDEFQSWVDYTDLNANPNGYAWDGTDNIAGDAPGSTAFEQCYFVDPNNKTFTALYEDVDDPTKITSVQYNGSVSTRTTQIAENKTNVDYGIAGAGENGLFIVTDSDGNEELNVFDSLIHLRDALENGGQPGESTLEAVHESLAHITDNVVYNSVNQKKLESMETTISAASISFTNRLSDVEDLDIALAASQLSALEVGLQASLQMVSRMNSMQLINFL